MSIRLKSAGSATEDSRPRTTALGPIRRMLVSYESSARGRAALFHALALANRAGMPLTVVSVARREPWSAVHAAVARRCCGTGRCGR